MPVYNGRNGIISHGEEAAGFSNESLADWTKQPDFVAVAVVRSASKLYPSEGESWGDQSATTRMLTDSETYGALQHIEVTKVLWRNASGIKPPPSLDIVNLGWSRNSDTGEVFALLPENGPRLDVGDTFVAAFYNDRHRFDEKYQATEQYQSLPAHWGIFNDQGAIKVVDGKLVTDERTMDYERPFAGLTIDEFTTKLIGATAS